MDLGSGGRPFGQRPIPGWQHPNDKYGFKEAYVVSDGLLSDAESFSELGSVEDLRGLACETLKESGQYMCLSNT